MEKAICMETMRQNNKRFTKVRFLNDLTHRAGRGMTLFLVTEA